MHAQHAQEIGVTGRHGTQSHERVGARKAQQVHQLTQLRRCITQNDTTTGVDVGTGGCQEQLNRLANLTRMTLAHRVVRTHVNPLRIFKGRRLERHVLGNIDHHRAWPS